MASIGNVDVICPVCSRDLHIPLYTDGTDQPNTLTMRLDRFYLRAHWLTHGPHGGVPLPLAA